MQPVLAIDGKRILHVACGGHHTLAVCEHDPKDLRRAHAASPAVHLLGAPALAATAMTALGAAPKAATGALMAAPRAAAGALRAGGMLMGDLVGTSGLFDIHESFPPPGAETTIRVSGRGR